MVSVIRAENVTKTYGRIKALDGVSLVVEKNSIFCICGPNGSGKTTLLDILTKTTQPRDGRVIVNGSVGYCHQYPRLWRDLSVKENLDIFMELYSAERQWINEMVGMTGMGEWLDSKVDDLSYGTQKRMELCVSLLPDSDIIAFDEPTTGLDRETVGNVLDLIRQLKGKKTIIIATHQLNDLNGLCDYLVILADGKIAFETEVKKRVDLSDLYSRHMRLGK